MNSICGNLLECSILSFVGDVNPRLCRIRIDLSILLSLHCKNDCWNDRWFDFSFPNPVDWFTFVSLRSISELEDCIFFGDDVDNKIQWWRCKAPRRWNREKQLAQ